MKYPGKVFRLLLDAGRIDQDVVRNMQSWRHSGFSVDRSVFLEAGDSAGIERLAQYMVRCSFRLCLETPRGRVGPNTASLACLRQAGRLRTTTGTGRVRDGYGRLPASG